MTDSVGNLRNISRHIGSELDEQAVMLDEFGAEIENAETKLDATMRKMAKVLHMSNGRFFAYPFTLSLFLHHFYLRRSHAGLWMVNVSV